MTAFASKLADGARWSLALVGVQTAATTLILVLSIRFGMGGLGAADLCMIGLAGLRIVGWAVSSQPVVATVFVVLADLVGVLLMPPKAWRNPWSETTPTYVLASAGLCGAAAVADLNASLLLYPFYFAVGNGAIAAVILHRRRRVR